MIDCQTDRGSEGVAYTQIRFDTQRQQTLPVAKLWLLYQIGCLSRRRGKICLAVRTVLNSSYRSEGLPDRQALTMRAVRQSCDPVPALVRAVLCTSSRDRRR